MSAVIPRIPIYKDFVLIQLAALVFIIDQFSKFLVRDFFGLPTPTIPAAHLASFKTRTRL